MGATPGAGHGQAYLLMPPRGPAARARAGLRRAGRTGTAFPVSHRTPAIAFLFAVALLCASTRTVAQAPATKPAPFEKDIRAFEAADAENPPAPGGVLFVGSSSIRLWKTLAEDFPGVPVINRGFGGSRIAHSTQYADRIVIPYKPKTVVFYAGDNDIAGGLTPEQVL